MTSLHNCTDIKKMQELIDSGADVNSRDDSGNTPLQKCCDNAHFFTYSYINNVSKEEIEKNPMYSIGTYLEIAKLLIKSGADINSKAGGGKSPLHTSVFSVDLTELLIKLGADINIKDYEGYTPLHISTAFDIEVARLLIKSGADINIKNNQGNKPIYNTVPNSEMNKLLIKST